MTVGVRSLLRSSFSAVSIVGFSLVLAIEQGGFRDEFVRAGIEVSQPAYRKVKQKVNLIAQLGSGYMAKVSTGYKSASVAISNYQTFLDNLTLPYSKGAPNQGTVVLSPSYYSVCTHAAVVQPQPIVFDEAGKRKYSAQYSDAMSTCQEKYNKALREADKKNPISKKSAQIHIKATNKKKLITTASTYQPNYQPDRSAIVETIGAPNFDIA